MIYGVQNDKLAHFATFEEYQKSSIFKPDGQFSFKKEFKNSKDKPIDDFAADCLGQAVWPWGFVAVDYKKGENTFVEMHYVFVPKATYVPVIKCADKTLVLVQDYFGEVKKGLNFAGHEEKDADPFTVLRQTKEFRIVKRGSTTGVHSEQLVVNGEKIKDEKITKHLGLHVTCSKRDKADVEAKLETIEDEHKVHILTIDLSQMAADEALKKLKFKAERSSFIAVDISPYTKSDAKKFVEKEGFVPQISERIARALLGRFGKPEVRQSGWRLEWMGGVFPYPSHS